jgi:hypothetical protein
VYKLITASFYDADLFRAWAEDMMVLTPLADILARPGLIAHATTTAARHEMSFSKGPSRPQLLKILAD